MGVSVKIKAASVKSKRYSFNDQEAGLIASVMGENCENKKWDAYDRLLAFDVAKKIWPNLSLSKNLRVKLVKELEKQNKKDKKNGVITLGY